MKQKGFTLVELLVVIAVTTIVSFISIRGYKAAERQKRVSFAFDTVVSTIRTAQTYTLTGRKTNNPDLNCRTPQYYFVTLNYSSNAALLSALNNCDTVDLIERFPFPTNTKVQPDSLVINSFPANTNIKLAFYLPYATMRAAADDGVFSSFTTASITVIHTEGANPKTITIDGVSGRIGE